MLPDPTNPAEPEVETSEPEPQEQDEPEGDEPEGPESDGDEPETDPDEELGEIDVEGKVYNLPKRVRDRILMHADYTRKTQDVAARSKAIEAEKARVAEMEAAHKELFEQRADLRQMDRELEQLSRVNWPALEQSDPIRASSLARRQMQLTAARQQLAATIDGKQQELSSRREREFATLWEQGEAMLQKEIPNWNGDTAKKLSSFAQAELGYAPEQLSRARPEDFRTLYLAQIGLQFLKQPRQPKPAPAPVQPIESPRPRRSASREPDPDRDPQGWMKWRNKQRAARA